ncbi:1798_t:CDS:2, partial [Racocetra persica]
DESSNDSVLECNFHSFSVLRLLAEIKNEIGTGKCDLTTQAGTSYAKYYTQEKNEELLKWCNWPSFILCLARPWVCVLEAVYVEKPIVDPLTDLIPLIPTNIRDHAERHYNQRAHELCSEIGKALKLLYISKKVVYSFYMVVIDYVKAKPLYNCNNSLSNDECKMVFENIEEAISKLHKKNIVFADLCDSNILVNKSQDQYQGMLIDFDWAGEEGIKCYPFFMNEDINWPPGAENRKKLSQEYDMHWLKLLKSNYLDKSVELE